MKFLRIVLILVSLVVVLTIGLSVYGKRGTNSPFAKVNLDGYTKAMTVAVTVFDASGAPVAGVSIESESHSGTSSPRLTDAEGFAAIEPGETEVVALHVDGREVWTAPYQDGFLDMFFLPSCANGISFTVNLKAEPGAGHDPVARPEFDVE